MKLSKVLSGFVLVSALVLFAGSYSQINAQQNSESKQVEAANQSFYKAFSNESITEMGNVWSHDSFVSAIHPASKNLIIGWDGVKKSFEAVFKEYKHITIIAKDPVAHIEGKVAWVLDHEELQAMKGKKTVKIFALATNIFVKQDGEWKMVHHHASVTVRL